MEWLHKFNDSFHQAHQVFGGWNIHKILNITPFDLPVDITFVGLRAIIYGFHTVPYFENISIVLEVPNTVQ
jgi:hypothetical protein